MPRDRFSLTGHLTAVLRQFPAASRYLVAFSGGADSTALLQALSEISLPHGATLAAIHVDHGLQADSARWAAHCERFCLERNIPFILHRLQCSIPSGESPEAAARAARYQAMAVTLTAGEMLLTAHQQEDQAETLLLHLLRGSGVAGLAAIPSCRTFAAGHLGRPLLEVGREELLDFLQQRQLCWIEDPSNRQIDYDRNFLRQRVMPLLRERWPALATTLTRSAKLCREAEQQLQEHAQSQLEGMVGLDGGLSVCALASCPVETRRLLLRHWLQAQGVVPVGFRGLQRLSEEMVSAAADRQPEVAWGDVAVRRYRDRLYLLRDSHQNFQAVPVPWSDGERLLLPGNGVLKLEEVDSGGIAHARWVAAKIEVRYRQGGERIQPQGSQHHRPLKQLLQEWQVPAWLRARQPLLYLDGVLAAVPGYCIVSEVAARAGQAGLLPVWQR